MKLIAIMALAAGALGLSSAHAADVAQGKAVFQAQCAMCHSAEPGQNGIGPTLAGVYGQKAASTPGFQFSSAMKNAKIVWTDAALDKFLQNPQADIPGTKMPYMGMPKAADRADVIAYLATLKGK